MRLVDLLARVDDEREVLDADVVVAMRAAVGGPEAEGLAAADAEVDDLLGAAIRREAEQLLDAERTEDGEVERERALDVGDGEVDVVDPVDRQRSPSSVGATLTRRDRAPLALALRLDADVRAAEHCAAGRAGRCPRGVHPCTRKDAKWLLRKLASTGSACAATSTSGRRSGYRSR
jgi:hypothetical protein